MNKRYKTVVITLLFLSLCALHFIAAAFSGGSGNAAAFI